MKKYLPALLAAILSGMVINSTYAAETVDVNDVTMDVIDHSDPQAVTNDIQLPDQANQEAKDHVAGTEDDSEHAQNGHDDSSVEDAKDDSHADAQEDAREDSQNDAQEEAHDAMEDANDNSASKGE